MKATIWPSSTSILMAIAMWHQLWWMSQCYINFVEGRNVTSTQGWMSQSNKDIVFCRFLTYTLMYVAYWNNHSWILSWDIMFEVSCNVAYPYFYVTIDVTWSLMIVTMSNNPWWMLQCNILFGECCSVIFQHQLWRTSQCNINFH